MGEEKSAAYYDGLFERSKTYAAPAHAAPWSHVWRAVVALVGWDRHVVDLGCGPGHLAELLAPMSESYTGVDFSNVAIAKAWRRCKGMENVTFLVGDLTGERWADGCDVAVCCEVLEHIADDFGVLAKIPSGKRVIFTVPDFDDAGHVRHFAEVSDVVDRYAQHFTKLTVVKNRNHYICEGRKC